MTKRPFPLIATLSLVGTLAALPATSAAQTRAPAKPAKSTSAPQYTDPHRRITAHAGKSFVLVLASNATTGYGWALVDSLRKRPVALVKHEYHATPQPKGRAPIVGSGGHEWWTFRATTTGADTIRLVYVRPWEKAPPADTTKFVVIVK